MFVVALLSRPESDLPKRRRDHAQGVSMNQASNHRVVVSRRGGPDV